VNASGFEAGEDRPAGLRTVFEPAPKCADLNHSRSADIGRKTRQLEFVVKLSKYCNLRCSYCYEFEDLHKKDRMNLGQIQEMFRHISTHAAEHNVDAVKFIWHGGEPFLFEPRFFREIAAAQAAIFNTSVSVSNTVQTNLTVLTEDMLSFLQEAKFFSGLGISFDPYGSQRVDTRGRSRVETVTKNMQTLIDRRIPFGAITVVARDTLHSVIETFKFFDTLNMSHRFLPYYRSANPEQMQAHSLTYDEILLSYICLVDSWLVSTNAPGCYPIVEYMIYAQRSIAGAAAEYFDYGQHECVFIVDVDGGTWGVMGDYKSEAKYGNLFEQDFSDVLAGENRARQKAEIDLRVTSHCGSCEYYGACPGKYVAEATSAERELIDTHGCIVKDVIAHILLRCEQTGMALTFAQPRLPSGLAAAG
jgi:uncharacterized protein